MHRNKENVFAEKFSLLDSQENSAEIHWSSSESSDRENTSINVFNHCGKAQSRKRKRGKKVTKNISNLEVSVTDINKGHRECYNTDKLHKNKTIIKQNSPVLEVTSNPPKFQTSPILTLKCESNDDKSENGSKSPILQFRNASPKVFPHIRKLFTANICDRIKSPTLSSQSVDIFDVDNEGCSESNQEPRPLLDEQFNKGTDDYFDSILSNSKSSNLDTSFGKLKANTELVKKVGSFFDGHFSSENASQHSISEVATPQHSSKSSEDIEIISLTQIPTKSSSTKDFSCVESPEITDANKKVKYKKDGLAYRLNALLKKKNANISLWQHERFLAGNSNFVIPKEECLFFRVTKVEFSYGCYLLQAMNAQDENYLILINSTYVNSKICEDSLFKLYEPYTIFNYHKCKLIINVCKFETDLYKS